MKLLFRYCVVSSILMVMFCIYVVIYTQYAHNMGVYFHLHRNFENVWFLVVGTIYYFCLVNQFLLIIFGILFLIRRKYFPYYIFFIIVAFMFFFITEVKYVHEFN